LRRYHKKDLVSEFHLNENIHNFWDNKEYQDSLCDFLDKTFKTPVLRLVSSSESLSFEGKPCEAFQKLLQHQAFELLPVIGKCSYYIKSDFPNDYLSYFKCHLDAHPWILKVSRVNEENLI